MKTDKDLLRLIGAGSDTPPHVACRCFAADLRRVYDAGKEEAEELRKQLAAAIAACKLKDEALQNYEGMLDELRDYPITHDAIIEAIAIQPDDSALKAWLGEPVAWKDTQARNRIIFPPMKPEEGDDGWIPIYSPKGLK